LSPKSAGPVPEPTEQSKTTQHLHRNDLHRNDLHRNERTSMSTLPPIRREVLVDADPATAFDVFTVGIGRWWPLRELSVYGADETLAFVDGEIVERSAEGEAAIEGTVTR
jgi:hypothetical protein